MSTPYNPLVPTGLVDLDTDYKNLQLNFAQADTTMNVDHVPFSVAALNGYHKVIHMTSFSSVASNPPNNQPVVAPPNAGVGELFCAQINDGINADEALYYQSGGGRITQLTRNLTPVSSTNGYTSIPGGLILQWGRIANPTLNGNGTLTYTAVGNINFPTGAFSVQLTYGQASGVNGSVTFALIGVPQLTGFGYSSLVNSSPVVKPFLYWTAIGN
jgi:hypothetical protein